MSVNYKVGEKVRFLHEDQEGVVQQILSGNMLEVLVDDFLEMEVHVNEVVKIHSEEKTLLVEEEEEDLPKVKPENLKRIDAPPSLVVLRKPNKDYEFWITNESTDEVIFTVFIRIKDKYRGIAAGTVPPNEKQYIGKSTSEDFHRANLISVQIIRFPLAGRIRPIPPLSLEYNCKKLIFNKNATNIPSMSGLGWEFFLEEEKSVQLPKSDFIRVKQENEAVRFSKPPLVVDLHIEKLVDNPTQVDSRTMLLIQLEHLKQKLSDARLKGMDKLVLIHGTGSKKLKEEIRRELRGYDFVTKVQAADPTRYGNGATLVEME